MPCVVCLHDYVYAMYVIFILMYGVWLLTANVNSLSLLRIIKCWWRQKKLCGLLCLSSNGSNEEKRRRREMSSSKYMKINVAGVK